MHMYFVCVRVRVRVCVFPTPEAINDYWQDIKPQCLVKQVLYLLYGSCK